MDKKIGLYKKILAVMADIQYLQKDDKVSTGASGSYKAISEEKVTETVRASLIKHGLVILPIEQEHKRDDTLLNNNGKETVSRLSTVNTKYKIVDVDTGEHEILASSGTGVDTQDKGVGKAMTYSYKYLFLRTFAIPTGDDPDKISSDELTDRLKSDSGIPTPKPATGQNIDSEPNTKFEQDFGKPRDTQKDEKPITQPQIKKIAQLCDEKMVDTHLERTLIQEIYSKNSTEELTCKEASDFISYLMKNQPA